MASCLLTLSLSFSQLRATVEGPVQQWLHVQTLRLSRSSLVTVSPQWNDGSHFLPKLLRSRCAHSTSLFPSVGKVLKDVHFFFGCQTLKIAGVWIPKSLHEGIYDGKKMCTGLSYEQEIKIIALSHWNFILLI